MSFPRFSFKPKQDKGKQKLTSKKTHNNHSNHRHELSIDNKSNSSVNDLYKVDITGDDDNIQYGYPYKKDIPKYDRYTLGILGLSPDYHIKPSKDLHDGIIVNKDNFMTADNESSVISKNTVTLIPEKNISIQLHDFIPISENDINSENGYLNSLFFQRIQLQSETKKNWKSLIYLELKIQKELGSSRYDTAEIILDLVVKSLENSNYNEGYSLLNDKNIINIFDTISSSMRWKQLTIDFPYYSLFWKNWINGFARENALNQREEGGFLDVFERLFKEEGLMDFYDSTVRRATLVNTLESDLSWTEIMDNVYVDMAFQLALTWKHAGYNEIASSFLQAILEFSLFMPDSVTEGSLELQLESFAEFYRTEEPRIGELDAVGWKYIDKNSSETKAELAAFKNESIQSDLSQKHESTLSESESGLSLRTYGQDIKDSNCDLFRMVLSEDFGEFLRKIQSIEVLPHLIWAFFSILGAPTPWDHEDITNYLSFEKQYPEDTLVNTIELLMKHEKCPKEVLFWLTGIVSSRNVERIIKLTRNSQWFSDPGTKAALFQMLISNNCIQSSEEFYVSVEEEEYWNSVCNLAKYAGNHNFTSFSDICQHIANVTYGSSSSLIDQQEFIAGIQGKINVRPQIPENIPLRTCILLTDVLLNLISAQHQVGLGFIRHLVTRICRLFPWSVSLQERLAKFHLVVTSEINEIEILSNNLAYNLARRRIDKKVFDDGFVDYIFHTSERIPGEIVATIIREQYINKRKIHESLKFITDNLALYHSNYAFMRQTLEIYKYHEFEHLAKQLSVMIKILRPLKTEETMDQMKEDSPGV